MFVIHVWHYEDLWSFKPEESHKLISIFSITIYNIMENYSFAVFADAYERQEKSSAPSGVMIDSCGWSREP